jgi:hypothetical protein
VCESGREIIGWLIKMYSKSNVGERGREIVHRAIKLATKSEVSGRKRESRENLSENAAESNLFGRTSKRRWGGYNYILWRYSLYYLLRWDSNLLKQYK